MSKMSYSTNRSRNMSTLVGARYTSGSTVNWDRHHASDRLVQATVTCAACHDRLPTDGQHVVRASCEGRSDWLCIECVRIFGPEISLQSLNEFFSIPAQASEEHEEIDTTGDSAKFWRNALSFGIAVLVGWVITR